jgi:hypothetical protein
MIMSLILSSFELQVRLILSGVLEPSKKAALRSFESFWTRLCFSREFVNLLRFPGYREARRGYPRSTFLFWNPKKLQTIIKPN